MHQYKVTIGGIVQGVGFRPFIYRTAKTNNIRGYIKNSGNSVELLLQGKDAEITEFLNVVKNNRPPLSRITNIDIKPCNDKKYNDFLILKSEKHGESDSVMPPDVAICDACSTEVFDKNNRRYLYPFTVCTDCGPRFTIIESLPYDRENTTMSEFGMCDTCKQEYFNTMDRRFRAEPVCCPDCGPLYELYNGTEKMQSKTPIKDAAFALDSGKIVAIKGIGGTHFCARTTDDDAIIRIRKILNRPYKPFAIMARNIIEAKKIAHISEKEEELLLSPQRPVVILEKKKGLSDNISPGLNNIGIMLSYSGMHHMLFYYSKQPAFVMTSANSPGEPMAVNNEDILSLNAEFSLIHNRKIKNRCDDSVIKLAKNNVSFIRRSRGFVPFPVEVKDTGRTVLSLGAELDVTACVLKKDKAFLTQYIGNTTKFRTLEYLESAIYNLMELVRADKIEAIAVDMHPSFNTSILGLELSKKLEVPLIKCQHHFAHAASLQAESGAERMVCITADGVGYGSDGTIWGGEIISVDDGFERVGSLIPQLMPGGDLAARYPARMAASILSKKFDQSRLYEIFSSYFERDELAIILKQIEKGFNSPLTTSTGRILDSIAAMLGVCTERTYEGEPAMKLEAFAMKGRDTIDIPVLIKKKDDRYMLDTTEIIKEVYLKKDHHLFHDIAASAQNAIARGLCRMAIKSAQDKNIDVIGFSGGVAYNDAIISTVRNIAEEEGFNFITHAKVPCGDGGISLGQTMIGASELE
ncbi:MAG: carbamoyltransferase HypF [Candidatus Methanoperedens sp.]|nr:carbamoyltransferase HypF [Candidatus Methanoperedens sp.]